jgi:hypothetical protein
MSLAAAQRLAAALGDDLGRDLGDHVGDLERADGVGQLAHAAQLVARDARAHRPLGARQARGDLALHFFDNNAPAGNASSGQRSWRFHASVPLSATGVRTDARGDRPASG